MAVYMLVLMLYSSITIGGNYTYHDCHNMGHRWVSGNPSPNNSRAYDCVRVTK